MVRREIAGRRVLITGASSGIGAAIARALVASGATVTLTARRAERLESLAQQIRQPPDSRHHAAALVPESDARSESDNVFVFPGDITSPGHREALLEFAIESMGGLDTLVNNAGTGAIGRFLAAGEDRLRDIMEVNFFSVTEMIRLAAPALQSSGDGVIVNIGSVLGHRAMPSKSEYCASKFAIHGFTDALRAELAGAKPPIDVLLISPSTTESEFFDQLIENDGSSRRNPYGMPADIVARKTLQAIKKGKYELILSPGGKVLVWMDRLSPALAGWIARRIG